MLIICFLTFSILKLWGVGGQILKADTGCTVEIAFVAYFLLCISTAQLLEVKQRIAFKVNRSFEKAPSLMYVNPTNS